MYYMVVKMEEFKHRLRWLLAKARNRLRMARSKMPRFQWRYLLFGALGLFLAGVVFMLLLIKDLPSADLLTSRQVFESTKIYDRTGEVLLYEIHGEEKRTVVPFEEIPEIVKQSTIAIEDENFYQHPAFDWKSIIRAFLINLSKGEISQGGSTITQQLAKNAFLTRARTITRKVRELFLAFKLEKKFSKDEILSLYLNQIPYGSNAYGIEAASQTFFNKRAKDLSLAQAALLAGLPKAPSYYSPHGTHLDEVMNRKNLVLEKMYKLGFINEQQKTQAQNEKLEFAPHFTGIKAPHFVLMIQDYLNQKYGEDFVRTAGLKVISTLDWNLQQAAEKAVTEGAGRNQELYEGHNAALDAEDANTGQILALVGSKDYFGDPEPENCQVGANCKFEGNFSVAAQGLRQPGSAIKPFAYIAAFKKGFTPKTVVFDLPTEFAANNPDCPLTVDLSKEEPGQEGEKNKECFHPRNFDPVFRGPVTLEDSLAQSINISAVKTLYLAGIDNMLKLAKDFGITTLTERSRYGLSLVLGGGEVKLTELAHAYAVFAQEGITHRQSSILKITDDEKTLEEYADEPNPVIDSQYARLINEILSDPEKRAPLFQNSLPLTVFPNQEVALKTGTTNDYRDAWAMGYTRSLVVGVWAGNNDNSPMHKKGTSILAAVPIWSAFMNEALKDRPTETFTKPDETFVEKPILNGEYIINFWSGGQKYPQVHDVLFYVNKNDPPGPPPAHPENDSQFQNWEEPVAAWARTSIPNFDRDYNQPLPGDAQAKNDDSSLVLEVISPQNGAFIKSSVFLAADIRSALKIKKLEVYFNNGLVDLLTELGGNYSYRKNLTLDNSDLQNTLRIIATDSSGKTSGKEIILYQ